MKNGNSENEDDGEQGHLLDFDDNTDGGYGSSKGLFGNPGTIMKEIFFLKQQMQVFGKEVEQVSKIVRGERTLCQHIDRISEVIGNAKEVKNIMHKIP